LKEFAIWFDMQGDRGTEKWRDFLGQRQSQ